MESTLGIPTTVKPGGNPAFRIKALRIMLADLEAKSAEVLAALKALGDVPKARKPDGGPETAPPWVEGQGFLPRIFAARPDVKALHDAFHAFPVLAEGTPAYVEARKAYVRALYGTTVESKIRKMNGQFIRRIV